MEKLSQLSQRIIKYRRDHSRMPKISHISHEQHLFISCQKHIIQKMELVVTIVINAADKWRRRAMLT